MNNNLFSYSERYDGEDALEWFKANVKNDVNFGDVIITPWPVVLRHGRELFLKFDETTEKYPGCVVEIGHSMTWKHDDFHNAIEYLNELSNLGKYFHISYINIKYKTKEYIDRISKYKISDTINVEDEKLELLGKDESFKFPRTIVEERDFIFKNTLIRYAIS